MKLSPLWGHHSLLGFLALSLQLKEGVSWALPGFLLPAQRPGSSFKAVSKLEPSWAPLHYFLPSRISLSYGPILVSQIPLPYIYLSARVCVCVCVAISGGK